MYKRLFSDHLMYYKKLTTNKATCPHKLSCSVFQITFSRKAITSCTQCLPIISHLAINTSLILLQTSN